MVGKKICYVASSGGHLKEIMGLFPLKDKYSSFLITEKTKFKPNSWQNNLYFVPTVDRTDSTYFLGLIIGLIKSFFIFIKEKPDVFVTSGALVAVPIYFIAKLFGNPIIYIESIARVETPSATGKFFYKRADLFIVQWEELLKVYPHAILGGTLI